MPVSPVPDAPVLAGTPLAPGRPSPPWSAGACLAIWVQTSDTLPPSAPRLGSPMPPTVVPPPSALHTAPRVADRLTLVSEARLLRVAMTPGLGW